MNLCEQHWAQLKKAIDERGLTHLISKDGVEAATRLVKGVEEGEASAETFDPLMGASLMIARNMMICLGDGALALLAVQPDAGCPPCPLCYGIEHCHCGLPVCDFLTWIDKAADGALAHARELKLVPDETTKGSN